MSPDVNATQSGCNSSNTSLRRDKTSIQVVEFLLGNEPFAIDLFEVKEVMEYTSITPLPNTPDYMRGIIDLRGEITTIVDLKHRLNITEKCQESVDSSRIIVLDSNLYQQKMGILVDDVTSVSTFDNQQVDYTSASGIKENNTIIGIIKRSVGMQEKAKTELIIWIDINQLLQGIS
ncbi:MAG: chemotaxis protein CheW [Methanospirillum sp.]|uniref:chemotaxis protein CheW n=1 Tax=Methanospirillum sp. TaxID=45200 RepID=UPI00236B7C26|nr:chemotaxis protein CheW [Methanospirillum sp.]MDD1727975.1 chemotaxis protein CheW [Methanospirillum sp.]